MENAAPKKVNVPNNTRCCLELPVVGTIDNDDDDDVVVDVFFTKCRASSRATCGGIFAVMGDGGERKSERGRAREREWQQPFELYTCVDRILEQWRVIVGVWFYLIRVLACDGR